MRMLSGAYIKTLAFSFFSEQDHTYENIWAWIWDSLTSCSRPEKIRWKKEFKNKIGRSVKFETFIFFWFVHHFKALNERISEWGYFLNLTKWFWRYLNFSAPNKGVFSDRYFKRELTYLKWHQKEEFWWAVLPFSGNKHS